MERKVQLAEQAATIFHSSLHHDYEKDELRRESRLSDRGSKSLVYDSATGGEETPPSTVGVAMSAENALNSTNDIVSLDHTVGLLALPQD